jgi:hypothetical protein
MLRFPLSLALAMLVLLCTGLASWADESPRQTPRDALRPFNDLIGSWRCTGEPEGTREQKQRGFWVETVQWEWQFKGDDAWLTARFDKSKHFLRGELRALPEPGRFTLRLESLNKEQLEYTGALADRKLTVERSDAATGETHRLVFTLLHNNRFVYRAETKPADRPLFTRRYQVGATKEGVPFAALATTAPECIVSGGLGTMPVTYQGETYYVCCTGCRDAFREEPEKYIKEYKEKLARAQKGEDK